MQKTNHKYDGQAVYRVTEKVAHAELKKGYYIYLDALHKDHLEVFTKNRSFKVVINLDGRVNPKKTEQAICEGRNLPK